MKKIVAVLGILAIISACSTYRPIVDMQNKTQQEYNDDLFECQQYAEQVSPATSAAVGAAGGAAAGMIFGAIIGAIFGVPIGEMIGAGAALGGASGAMSGAGAGASSQMNIIKRCMQGRGYSVLH